MLTVRKKWGSVFQTKFFFKVFCWSRRKQFWQFCNKKIVISQKELFRPKSKRLKKIFRKNCFPSNCPSENVGSSFENFTGKLVPKVRKNYAQIPSMYQTRSKFSGKSCFSKRFPEHVEIGFDNPNVHFLAKVRKHFDYNPTKKDWNSSQKFLLIKEFVWIRRKQFWQIRKEKFPKVEKGFACSPNIRKNQKFVKNLFLHFVS